MESREEGYRGETSVIETGKMAPTGGSGEGGKDDNKNSSSSSLMLGLLEEFTKIYSDRLQRVEETAIKCDQKQYLENKVRVLESWIRDLGEQNAVLVVTVEELEREAADRVALLEDRLSKMATTTRESCVSLRDHQIQVSSLVTDKIGLEKKAQGLGEKVLTLERRTLGLKEENANLQSDLNNLIQVISRARQTGQWEVDDLTFSCVTPEQVFGPVLSSSRRSSQSLKESQRDYLHQIFEDHLRKDNSSLASSFSNLQDADSAYGGRGSEKDLIIMKLRADLRSLQSTHEETNRQLLERDKHIADLQTQLTETHHELALSQAEVSTVNQTLQEVRHHNRHENVEITRKDEVIRHLLSKQSIYKKDCVKGSLPMLCDLDNVITGENNVEAQLSENIDVLASRLAELEEECQQLRIQHTALQDTHALCTPTINMLQEQLNRSHQNALTPMKDGVYSGIKETISAETQTDKILSNKNEESSRGSPNGFYATMSPSSQISKLENELAEKSVLLRELQSHLAASRQELHLKDETLHKLEKKLDSSRREGNQRGGRMQYLTGQLTSLQLEVGRTHGQAEQLRRQVEKKAELIEKLEVENSSLTHQLNEKSATLERFQTEIVKTSTELERKRKEVSEQKMTIRTLQEALVASKRSCDDLRSRLDCDVSLGMFHHSLPLKCDSSNNPLASNPSVTKSIPVDSSIPHVRSELTNACVDESSSSVNTLVPTLPVSGHNCGSGAPLIESSISYSRTWQHNALKSVDSYSCDTRNVVPDVRPNYECPNDIIIQNTSCVITPDVLSSCSSNALKMNSTLQQNSHILCSASSEFPRITNGQNTCGSMNVDSDKVNVEEIQNRAHTGQVYDV